MKLKLVEMTMKNCNKFSKECMKKSKDFEKHGNIELKEYFEGQSRAFQMVAEFLKEDLK